MPHRLDSGEFQLSELDLSKYFSSDHTGPSIDAISMGPTGGSFESSDGKCYSQSAYSNTKNSLSNFAKTASVSPQNEKYLGVRMGHVDFVGQHIETNEDSLNCVINEMDNLLPNNSSLKDKVEKRIKTAFELTYNWLVKKIQLRHQWLCL